MSNTRKLEVSQEWFNIYQPVSHIVKAIRYIISASPTMQTKQMLVKKLLDNSEIFTDDSLSLLVNTINEPQVSLGSIT